MSHKRVGHYLLSDFAHLAYKMYPRALDMTHDIMAYAPTNHAKKKKEGSDYVIGQLDSFNIYNPMHNTYIINNIFQQLIQPMINKHSI